MTSQPYYKCSPIHSTQALARALGFEELFLKQLASSADALYRLAKPIVKADGSIRQPFDALAPLKEVHRRIKSRIFSQVAFPYYLTGSIKGRDYRTNAQLHTGSKIIICEDIANFFPSTSSLLVRDIWQHFFGFSEDVAMLLTQLTTKSSTLPQGAITSSYLANLAFWRFEPALHAELKNQGISYSRYVDDITVSSRSHISNEDKTALISNIYGMLMKLGYRAKRRKHETYTSSLPMFTTKLQVNTKPALTSRERAQIRAAVFQLENQFHSTTDKSSLIPELNIMIGRVGKLRRFHPIEGKRLSERLTTLRNVLSSLTD